MTMRHAAVMSRPINQLRIGTGARCGRTLAAGRGVGGCHVPGDGVNAPLLLACSRHASVRSLERYARPGPEAIARHVAAQDPAARRRTPAEPNPGA